MFWWFVLTWVWEAALNHIRLDTPRLAALFLSLSSVAHTDVVAVLCSPVCLTAVCSSRRRAAGRAHAAGHRGLCRCCSIWTSARAGYSRYTHTSEESVSAERSLEWMLCVCVCGLTPALSRWPAGAAVFWLCWGPWTGPSVRSRPETGSPWPDPAVWEESPHACSPDPDRTNNTDTQSFKTLV